MIGECRRRLKSCRLPGLTTGGDRRLRYVVLMNLPALLLRKNVTVAAYPDDYRVILVMADGFELEVGSVSRQTGAHHRELWQWSCPGGMGQAVSRDEAMAAIRAAWNATDPDLATIRQGQEWTANKYALWDAGYRDKMGKGPLRCRCGEMFDAGIHEETMAHVQHITGRRAGI